MKKLIHHFAVGIALVAGTVATAAAAVEGTDRIVRELPLDLAGAITILNPLGRVEVIGGEGPVATVTAIRHVNAKDEASLTEGREQTQIIFRGDAHGRIVQTVYPPPQTRNDKWTSYVDYSIRVPRTVHVTIDSHTADRLRVSNIRGNVVVKNVNGPIILEGLSGATMAQSINGNILADYTLRPQANAQLTSVNGNIELRVPPDTNMEWLANTLKGDVYAGGMPVRGRFVGPVFHGSVNSPGGPTFTTSTFMGRISLVRKGTAVTEARSVSQLTQSPDRMRVPAAIEAKEIQTPLWDGPFVFTTTLGDVLVGEIRGSARIETHAGLVDLGMVSGRCDVTSLGGPMTFGDIFGQLNARTVAGDVFVRTAREGGTISTGGGIVRVLYTGGPTNLHSGGGDIVVRQASGPITAETRSGDISITIDPTSKTESVDAHAVGGNIAIFVNPRFSADIDATILSSPGVENEFKSDLPGVTIRRDQVGNKTRIHATGKINGGGEKLVLNTEDGDIHLVTQTLPPITVMSPQGQR
jgi:DUF4097 and DUF4098 domain-containing protein YvlB